MRTGVVRKTLINATTYNANTNVDITDMLYGIKWVAPPVFYIDCTEVDNGTTLDIDVLTSQDGGNKYQEVLSMTQLSASGNELKNFTVHPWGQKARLAITFGAAGSNWTITAKVAGIAEGGSGS